MSQFNKDLKRERVVPVKWKGIFPEKKTQAKKTFSGEWDDKRLQSRKIELQEYWDSFAHWADEVASKSALDVFADLEVVRKFLANAQMQTHPEADTDPDPVSFKIPGELSDLNDAHRQELKEHVQNLLPPGSVSSVELARSSRIVVSVYFMAANADTNKGFLQLKVNKGKFTLRVGGQDFTAVPLEEGEAPDDDEEEEQLFASARYTEGSNVEVFSRGQKKWVTAKVTAVDPGKFVTVVYSNVQGNPMSKMLEYNSSDLRAVSTGNDENREKALALSPEKAAPVVESGPEGLKQRPSGSTGSSIEFDPTVLTGNWKVSGHMDGEKHSEYLQLKATSKGKITGMVDANGDGVFDEQDCKVDKCSFDFATGRFSFEQIYPENTEGPAETIYWTAAFDREKDRLVDGEWLTSDGNVTGTFTARRQDNSSDTKASTKKKKKKNRDD